MLAVFDPTNPLTWIQGGAIGAAVGGTVACFVKGWLVSGRHYQSAVTRAEVAEAENKRIHERLEGEVFTALKEAAIAVASTNQIMRDALRK